MKYSKITQDDIFNVLTEKEISSFIIQAGTNGQIVDEIISQCVNYIKTFLIDTKDLAEDEIPICLKSVCLDICAYRLINRVGISNITSGRKTLYDDAMGVLREIASGNIDINKSSSKIKWGSQKKVSW